MNNPITFPYPYYFIKNENGSETWYIKPDEERVRWSKYMYFFYKKHEGEGRRR